MHASLTRETTMALLSKIPSAVSQSPNIFKNENPLLLKGQASVLPFHRRSSQHLTVKSFQRDIGNVILEKIENGHVVPTHIERPQIARTDFPHDFMFGAATSALQTEGAGDEGGRGPSTWDDLIQDPTTPGKDIAVDSYHRYKEDVKLLKDMGANAYRFSISWSRILPKGTFTRRKNQESIDLDDDYTKGIISGEINQEGIDFYNNLIDELRANGITPFVTLFHFDLPQALQDEYDGFLNPKIVDDFKNYADVCFHYFGDRVKHWTTINEPQVFAQYGYKMRSKNPNPQPATDPFLVTHNIILAHATAAKLYKEQYKPSQGGGIGISLVCQRFLPYSEKQQDKDAADRATDFLLGWYMNPFVYGDYPFDMKALVRESLPTFSEDQKILVKGSCDFIGVNYYTSRFAKSIPFKIKEYKSFDEFQYADLKAWKDKQSLGYKADGSDAIYIYPDGLRDILIYLKRGYEDPKIYVTENGVPSTRNDSIPLEEELHDDFRIEHIEAHLNAVKQARKDGVKVKGFFIWTLMDNMEVGSYYNVRYGLNYVDYLNNLDRYPKKSAKWLGSFLK